MNFIQIVIGGCNMEIALDIQQYRGRFEEVSTFQATVCGVGNEDVVMIGLGIMNFRAFCKVGGDKAAEILKGLMKEDNKDYLEFFIANLEDGIDIMRCWNDSSIVFIIENIEYCLMLIKDFVTRGIKEKKEDKLFWLDEFCRAIEICVFYEDEACEGFYGVQTLPIIHISYRAGKYMLLLPSEGSNQKVCKVYNDTRAVNDCLHSLLLLKKKYLGLKKRRVFIEIYENIAKFDSPVKVQLNEYYTSVKNCECLHKFFPFKPLCKVNHCSFCLYDKCKLTVDSRKMKCLCDKPLSPKNYSDLSRIIKKLQKKQKRKSVFSSLNLEDLSKVSQGHLGLCPSKIIKAEPLQPQKPLIQIPNSKPYPSINASSPTETSLKCLNCSKDYIKEQNHVNCRKHSICKDCRKTNMEKCIYCNRSYNNTEKDILRRFP